MSMTGDCRKMHGTQGRDADIARRSGYFRRMKVFGIAGWSGSGKTTLLIRLLPVLAARGVAVGTLKHTHHRPAIGTDETRALAAAGAVETLIAAPRRWALLHEWRAEAEPAFEDLVPLVGGIDLLLVEGYKHHPHPKLEVYRQAVGKPPLWPDDPFVAAIAADVPPQGATVPVLALDDAASVADFILAYCGIEAGRPSDAAE